MICGWIPRSRWLEKTRGYGRIDGLDYEPETCPGYTARLPGAQEVARAWGWEQSATGFVRRYEILGVVPTEQLVDLVDVYAGEHATATSWELEQRSDK